MMTLDKIRGTSKTRAAALFVAILLVVGIALPACSTNASAETITGKVTSIDGSDVTIELGEISDSMPGKPDGDDPHGGEPLAKPDGDDPSGGEPPARPGEEGATDNEPPAKPDGEGLNDDFPAKPDSDGASGSEPPAKPDGDDSSNGEPPAKPDNDDSSRGESPAKPGSDADGSDDDTNSSGNRSPSMPDGQIPGQGGFSSNGETMTLDLSGVTIEGPSFDDIEVGDLLEIELNSSGKATNVIILGAAGRSNSSGSVDQGSAAYIIDEDGTYDGSTYTSDGDDENALRIVDADVALDGANVDKSGGDSSDTEDGDFYGMNAALLVTDGATADISNATIDSAAQNGNGVFSYGEGTVVNISDSSITTSKDNSGGIQTTGGATTNASNLTIETSGNSSAAIRSDRGGGIVIVDGGTYTSKGYNSPAIYSTADIRVSDARLTAEGSEALVIEGKNSISLSNCIVSGNMSDTKGASSSENVHNVMIYQSMSGDADVGSSSFEMVGGTLTSMNGDMFYVTNTHCTIALQGVTIDDRGDDGYLLNITGNSGERGWGQAGSNGGQADVTMTDQVIEGDIRVDSISTLNLTLSGSSSFKGTIGIEENAEGGSPASENAVVTIEDGAVWELTGDCTITSLDNAGTIVFNGHTITLADGTVLSA